MKLSPEQLTALETKFAFMREILTEHGGVGLVWGANRNTSEGSVTLSLDELDALLSDVQELRAALTEILENGGAVDEFGVCDYCLRVVGIEEGHAPDCPWNEAKKLLEVSR